MAMLLVNCYVALLAIGCIGVLAMESQQASSSDSTENPCEDEQDDGLPSSFSRLSLSRDEEPKTQGGAEKTKVQLLFEALKQYGIENMTASGLSEEERARLTEEYYERCSNVSTSIFCKIACLDDPKVRGKLLNGRVLLRLAADQERMEEVKDSFGEIPWLHLVGLCPNLSIAYDGCQNLPRKAILAMMSSNCPFYSHYGRYRLPVLNWNKIFESPIEPEFEGFWRWLTVTLTCACCIKGDIPLAKIAEVIAKSPSTGDGVRGVIDQCVRIVCLERIAAWKEYQAAFLESLEFAVQVLRKTVIPLQALIVKRDEKCCIGRLRKMFLRPPEGMPVEHVLQIYGLQPLVDESAASTIEDDLDTWNAHIDQAYSHNQHCKALFLLRHLTAFPEEILHPQLRKITKDGQDPLPSNILKELARKLTFSEHKQSFLVLKACFHTLSKGKPLFAIRYAMKLMHLSSNTDLCRIILADALISDMRQVVINLARSHDTPQTITLPNPDDGPINLQHTMASLSYSWALNSKNTRFITPAGQPLADPEVNALLLQYFGTLFSPENPRAFLLDEYGFYWPAYGLDIIYMHALSNVRRRSISVGHIDFPYRISPDYIQRLQRWNEHQMTVENVYSYFLDKGMAILAADFYFPEDGRYTGAPSELINPAYCLYGNAFYLVLLSGRLERDELLSDAEDEKSGSKQNQRNEMKGKGD